MGDNIAKKVGQIWGIGEDGEMANMWKATPQKDYGLWQEALPSAGFILKYLAMQIKMIEENLSEFVIRYSSGFDELNHLVQ